MKTVFATFRRNALYYEPHTHHLMSLFSTNEMAENHIEILKMSDIDYTQADDDEKEDYFRIEEWNVY